MTIKQLSPEEFTDIYNNYMINDFPASELKPLERILYTMSIGLCCSFGLYHCNELKGYCVFIIPHGSNYCLLDYLAILKGNRGSGFGHQFFQCLKSFFNDAFPALKGIFMECESIDSASNPEEHTLRTRRISFYERNGCAKTKLSSCVFNVEYVILYYSLSGENLNDGFKDLNFIYKKMFKPHHYKNNVRLWTRLDEAALSMSAKKLAPFLIGKLLCRKTDDGILKYRITETECYCGEEDTACHAHKGMTERTKTLYEKGGTSYVYLCYGIHNLFNVVSGTAGHPEAVLIRGVEGYNGPGKLTRALHIDRSLNGIDMTSSDLLWLEDDGTRVKYRRDKRVGIDYATPKYRDILWRFIAVI